MERYSSGHDTINIDEVNVENAVTTNHVLSLTDSS